MTRLMVNILIKSTPSVSYEAAKSIFGLTLYQGVRLDATFYTFYFDIKLAAYFLPTQGVIRAGHYILVELVKNVSDLPYKFVAMLKLGVM